MRRTLPLVLLTIISALASCKDKKPKEKQNLFASAAMSTIHEQVAEVDTSLYSIRKVVYVDSLHSDTTYIRREDFRAAAQEFLELPDLSDPVYYDRFKEEDTYDENLGRVLVVYTPVNSDRETIQREEILIRPDSPKDKVTTIIVNTNIGNRDSSVSKRMLWSVDQNFQVITIRQYPGKPEITSTYKVSWNESDTE